MVKKVHLLNNTLPLYVQVPFCPERCDYCSIPVSTRMDEAGGYIDALSLELARISPYLENAAALTIYIGGGSPTSLPKEHLEKLLGLFAPYREKCVEWTAESRPEGLTDENLALLYSVGVTRLSIGIESWEPERLGFLGRSSSVFDPVTHLVHVRNRFAGAVSMDFIVGGGSFDTAGFKSLAGALLSAGLDHLSFYPLTLEGQTSLLAHHDRTNTVKEIEEGAASDWLDCISALSDVGWERYEVANCSSRKETRCLHNLLIWEGADYLGIGAGAHQRVQDVRTENVRSFREYVDRTSVHLDPFSVRELLSGEELFIERLLTRLRVRSGMEIKELVEWIPESYVHDEVLLYVSKGLVCEDEYVRNSRIVCTEDGLNQLDDLVSGLIWGMERAF
jgi:oxygen-independent coproporphyrinogen-3 oxidase